MNGIVVSGVPAQGGVPLRNAVVYIYAVSDPATTFVGTAVTDADGRFSITPAVTTVDGTMFALAYGSYSALVLAALLGPRLPDSIVINELTTVATAYCAAQLLSGTKLTGSVLALRIAAAMSANVVDVTTGDSSTVLQSPPNAMQTNAWCASRSLANLLASCVRDGECSTLFGMITSESGGTPGNTLSAAQFLALDPAQNVAQIYAQSQQSEAYDNLLTAQPDAWTLAVKVNDSGSSTQMFGGPANVAFDSKGNAWIANNVEQGTPKSTPYCMVLDMGGHPAVDANGTLMTPFTGGLLIGAGYGIALDSQERVWIGSFGWGKVNPGGSAEQGAVTVFDFSKNPPVATGYAEGIYKVQAVAVDDDDNVWAAGWGNGVLAVYPGGLEPPILFNNDPQAPEYISDWNPFGIAIDGDGRGWITDANSSGSRNVQLQLDVHAKTLTKINQIDAGMQVKGIVIDKKNDVIWFASGADSSVYAYQGNTRLGQFNTGSLDAPWSVTLDGSGDVWVANFGALQFIDGTFSGRLTKLAGYGSPSGIGTELTPTATGYTLPSGGDEVLLPNGDPLYGAETKEECMIPFMRATSVNIDAAGNLWAVNNWKPVFKLNTVGDLFEHIPGNPGGDGIVIFLGIAPPR